jgi:hypothetical protein
MMAQVTPRPPSFVIFVTKLDVPLMSIGGAGAVTATVTLEVMVTVEEPDLLGSATEAAEIVACEGVARIIDGAV